MPVGLAAFPGRRGPAGKGPVCGERAHAWELWPRLHATSLGAPRSILSSPLSHKGRWVLWIWLRWEEEDPTAPLLWKLLMG